MPRLFGPLADRYRNREGGYTRILRIEPIKEDQAPSAILELVDGVKDMRFHLAAKAVAYARTHETPISEITAMNIRKACAQRENGAEELDAVATELERFQLYSESDEFVLEKKRAVYGPTFRPADADWGVKGHRRHEMQKIREQEEAEIRENREKDMEVWKNGWRPGDFVDRKDKKKDMAA